MRILYPYLKRYWKLISLALFLAAVNITFSLLDPTVFRLRRPAFGRDARYPPQSQIRYREAHLFVREFYFYDVDRRDLCNDLRRHDQSFAGPGLFLNDAGNRLGQFDIQQESKESTKE